ncbi:helix-turn-helix domain-containing protein [Pseudarthrobacter sp. NPDC092184]|uniref:helix-turn-helix domain-containing protein n=1 Tax=unclassified Pseudarthrobacter TaxID=2647000 RepID=UPI0037F61E2F
MTELEHLCGASTGRRAEFLAMLILFLDDLVRVATDKGQTLSTSLSHPSVVEGIRLMEASLDDSWTLKDLACKLHMTPSHTVRLFKSQTGLPPLAYLAKRRAEAAARLLISTDYTVSRVGREVGWSEPNYFARRFRSHFGVPPTTYRERFRPEAGPD